MSAPDDEFEYLDLGAGAGPPKPRVLGGGLSRRRLGLGLVGAVVLALGVVALLPGAKPTPSPPVISPTGSISAHWSAIQSPSATPTLEGPPTAEATVTSESPSTVAVATSFAPDPVVTSGPALAGGKGELFLVTDNALIRIELASGRRTTTPLPTLTGPLQGVTLVVGGQAAMIRRLVDGGGVELLRVADGHAAVSITTAGNDALPWLPGPDADHLWEGSGMTDWVLADYLKGMTPTSVSLPNQRFPLALAGDGAGYFVIQTYTGAYDWAPARGWRRVTTGHLLAAGPTRYLVEECDDKLRCQPVVIDRRNGAGHRLVTAESLDLNTELAQSTISPDGRFALLGMNGSGRLVDLVTGKVQDLAITGDGLGMAAVWAPDGRLLIVTPAHALNALDPRTGAQTPILPSVPVVHTLAVRG